MSSEEKKLKQEIVELSIELAKQQDEIDHLIIYKQKYLAQVGKLVMLTSENVKLKELLCKHNIEF